MDEHQHQGHHHHHDHQHDHHHQDVDGTMLVDHDGTVENTTAPKGEAANPAGFPSLEEPQDDLPPDTECMCDKSDDEQALPTVSAANTSSSTTTTTTTVGETAKVAAPGGPETPAAARANTNTNSGGNPAAVLAKVPAHVAAEAAAKKKRLCRYPGCVKVIKSQGHCQRHGAKAKRCKVEACDKQAQGTHDGMCKRHWKAANFPEEVNKKGSAPPEPEGESVYDSILPMSIAYRPVQGKQQPVVTNLDDPSKHDLLDPPAAPAGYQTMPLVAHLKDGSTSGKQAGWHRNAERRARGMYPVKGLSVQLEPWERQLAMIEIMLLSGGTPYANFKELAFAWGREKGFHHVLANSVCERRGEVERKKRSDCGKSMTEDERNQFRSKLQKTRDKNGTSKKARHESLGGESVDGTDQQPMVVEGGGSVPPPATAAAAVADNTSAMEGVSMPKMESVVAEANSAGAVASATQDKVDGEETTEIADAVATQPVFV